MVKKIADNVLNTIKSDKKCIISLKTVSNIDLNGINNDKL